MLLRRTLPFRGAALALAVATPGLGAEEIHIGDAVRIALARNAELATVAADVSAAGARLGGTTLLAQRNPHGSVGGGSRRTVEGRAGSVEVEVVQELEVGAQFVQARRALGGGRAVARA